MVHARGVLTATAVASALGAGTVLAVAAVGGAVGPDIVAVAPMPRRAEPIVAVTAPRTAVVPAPRRPAVTPARSPVPVPRRPLPGRTAQTAAPARVAPTVDSAELAPRAIGTLAARVAPGSVTLVLARTADRRIVTVATIAAKRAPVTRSGAPVGGDRAPSGAVGRAAVGGSASVSG